MLGNYRLQFVSLIIMLALVMTAPVRGDPGPFGKITPPNGAEHQSLTPTFSWEDSEGAIRYEYCYDTTDDDLCAGTWISSGTVTLPPSGLTYNTTYYWQVRAIDAGNVITYADGGTWWSFITRNPALTVDKALTSQGATSIVLGTVLTYTITAINSGDVILSDVVVSDPLMTPTSGTSPCATLSPAASCTLVGTYTVTQADVDAGVIVNTGRAVSNEVAVAATDTVTTPIPRHPALMVDKVLTGQGATPISLGTVLTYTITATNAGNVTLSSVVIGDPLVTPSSMGCSPMTPDATCVLIGFYEVQELDFMAGEIVNIATVTADDPNGDPLTPVTDSLTTPLVAAPPVAYPDASLGNPIGQAVTVDVLLNDMRGDLPLDPASVVIVNSPPGGTLSPDGKMLWVPGEGIWLVNTTTGAITFTPAVSFTGNPTSITYTVDDIQSNTSSTATVTITYTPPPEANDDASLGNPIGQPVTVDVVENDEAAAGRTLDRTSVVIVVADAGSGGKTLTVSGEGVWTVDPETGAITFAPEVGFQGNPAAIQYTIDDDQGNTSNAATVIVSYTDNPLARNDILSGNPVGSAVTVDVLANDVASLYRTLDPATVQIIGTASPGDSLAVMGQGLWSVYTATGAITFTPAESFDGNPTPITYTVDDDRGDVSNAATVTVTFYTPPPVANDDTSLNNLMGSVVTVVVLANDVASLYRTLDPASVQIIGTENPGESLVFMGQGTWSVYTMTGIIMFTPEVGFVGNPMPIMYTVDDDQGNTSNPAIVTITYTDKQFLIYLPLTVRLWPPIPTTPVLNVIDNPNGYGDYTVSWSDAERATSYILQESLNSSFGDAIQVYSGTNISIALSDRGPMRYYYRVQARNAYGDSAWSNVRSVDVLWEKEPNDDVLTEANGPLISGPTYYGRFLNGEDRQDYFFIDLQSAQSVELWLSNIAAGQDYDLTLRDTALQPPVAHSGELGNANEHIRTGTLPAGLYYIQVYNRSGNGSTQPYHLQVSYPAEVLNAFERNIPILAPWFSNSPPMP
jgi:uncharacterized repeat protein (TIGR01451 family)